MRDDIFSKVHDALFNQLHGGEFCIQLLQKLLVHIDLMLNYMAHVRMFL
jgi:hypothetical protein